MLNIEILQSVANENSTLARCATKKMNVASNSKRKRATAKPE
jgi:hypothetical protein